jgi:exodeoxyribonuclease VII large subunit
MFRVAKTKLDSMSHLLELIRTRPALASPGELINQRIDSNNQKREFIFRILSSKLKIEFSELAGQQSTLRALSPQGTLDRGFAIVRKLSGEIVRSANVAQSAEVLQIRFADGDTEVKPIV